MTWNQWFDVAGAVASVITLLLVVWAVNEAKAAGLAHARTHIRLIRDWAVGGTAKAGWPRGETAWQTLFAWSHPGAEVFHQGSAPAVSQLGLAHSFNLHPEVIEAFAEVAQALDTLNGAIQSCRAFKYSDSKTAILVSTKFGARDLNETLIPDGVDRYEALELALSQMQLTPFEQAWCLMLLEHMLRIHEVCIGGPNDGMLHDKFRRLETVFKLHHGGPAPIGDSSSDW